MNQKKVGQTFYHMLRSQLAFYKYCQVLSGVLVNHRQDLQWASIMRSVRHEIIRPHMIWVVGTQSNTGTIVQPQSASLRLLFGHFQSFPTPYPLDSLVIHSPTLISQHSRNHAIAISAVLGCKSYYSLSESFLIIGYLCFTPLRGTCLPQYPTGSPLGYFQFVANMLYSPATSRRAQKFPLAASFNMEISKA